MKSISITVNSGDTPAQQAVSADVNAVMGVREWGLILIPANAIFLGVMVLGERPGWNAFGGTALIFMGLVAIDGRLIKGFRRQKGR